MTSPTLDEPEPGDRTAVRRRAVGDARDLEGRTAWPGGNTGSSPEDALRWQRAGVVRADRRRALEDRRHQAGHRPRMGLRQDRRARGGRLDRARVQRRRGAQAEACRSAPPSRPTATPTGMWRGRPLRRPRPASPQAGLSRVGVGDRRFMEAVRGRDPRVMHSYMQRQWFDDEAIAWATHGIEAADALAWKELGLTPVEAERYRTREHESDANRQGVVAGRHPLRRSRRLDRRRAEPGGGGRSSGPTASPPSEPRSCAASGKTNERAGRCRAPSLLSYYWVTARSRRGRHRPGRSARNRAPRLRGR